MSDALLFSLCHFSLWIAIAAREVSLCDKLISCLCGNLFIALVHIGNGVTGQINCNSNFFAKIIAFFKGLFGLLPTVTIKP